MKRGAVSLLCGPRVTGRWLEPSFDINQIWLLPSRFDTKAMVSPSGDTVGCELSAGSFVGCTAAGLVIGCRKIWRGPVRRGGETPPRTPAVDGAGPAAPRGFGDRPPPAPPPPPTEVPGR